MDAGGWQPVTKCRVRPRRAKQDRFFMYLCFYDQAVPEQGRANPVALQASITNRTTTATMAGATRIWWSVSDVIPTSRSFWTSSMF